MPFLKINVTAITVYSTVVLDQILHIVMQYEMFSYILSVQNSFFNKQSKNLKASTHIDTPLLFINDLLFKLLLLYF